MCLWEFLYFLLFFPCLKVSLIKSLGHGSCFCTIARTCNWVCKALIGALGFCLPKWYLFSISGLHIFSWVNKAWWVLHPVLDWMAVLWERPWTWALEERVQDRGECLWRSSFYLYCVCQIIIPSLLPHFLQENRQHSVICTVWVDIKFSQSKEASYHNLAVWS